ncbi:zn2-c6 fungal-type dna-binding domain-containing [Trichoderma arundinaceum]|uniref:Zn2-c6 fungal-type dna-binding domain-containing n=1 Tax=Trichoderma arundinaceum TaxID=490622 RepID=A0A395NVH8_TRIAR|nr:zn2-c6 fungal-type dna-binding domain-containing [Trichoderma arundinaceum]
MHCEDQAASSAHSAEVEENFEALRDAHANFFDNLFSLDTEPIPSQFKAATNSVDMTLTPSAHSDSDPDIHVKPSFNLASAESLLMSFRSMLCHFPCIILSPDASVSRLAKTQPFVLLAILAAASGSQNLQGNSLYDEEFRKVLGLKFVAGGERTLEVLQGILIYCGWYPFHLRPRNKHAFHYICMATDVVHDLKLDQETPIGLYNPEAPVAVQHLDNIRAYLGYFYLVSSLSIPVQWQSRSHITPVFTSWTATCCSILERCNSAENDVILASLARLSSTATAALHTIHHDTGNTHQQSQLVLLGLEAQLRDTESLIPSHIASTPIIYMHSIFVHLCLKDGALVRLPRLPPHLVKGRLPLPPIASELYASIDIIRELLSYVLSLDEVAMAKFSTADWSRFIFLVILAIRLSLAVPECPEFDTSWARSRLRFDETLEKMCQDTNCTTAPKKVDILSAMRAVMRVIKDKYNKRLHILEHGQEMMTSKLSLGCPMLDGSMDGQFELWQSALDADSALATAGLPADVAGVSSEDGDTLLNDLWATTTGWGSGDVMSEW